MATLKNKAITTGHLHSLWEGKKERTTTYFDDDTQLNEVISFLFGILKDTPGARQPLDPVAFVFDVLLPETVIYSLVEVHSLSVQNATELYKQGPQYEPRELDLFQICLQQNLSAEATKRLQDFELKMRKVLQSERFLKQL